MEKKHAVKTWEVVCPLFDRAKIILKVVKIERAGHVFSKHKLKGILSFFRISFMRKILHVGRGRFRYNMTQEFKSRSFKSKEAL